MGLQVDSLEVEVEFQVDVEDRDSGAPDPWDDSTGADPAVVTEGESDSTTDMARGYTTDVGSSEETAEWVSDEVDDAAAHQPVEDETDDAAAHQPVKDETDDAAAHQPVEDETDVAEEEPSAAVGSDTVDAPEAGGAEVEEPPEAVEESPTVQGFTFGKRDPTDKAKRLARVLVSDMIMYNAERHQSALAAGTLVQDFEEEIEKSWKEYVDQVGAEMADGEGRGYWTRALNDILAKGDEVF
jgi:hypothetical protein